MSLLASLFNIVQRQFLTTINTNSTSTVSSSLQQLEENNALLAVEILCDVMSKKYIPRGESNDDTGAMILVELIAQAVGLLQQMSSHSSSSSSTNLEDISTILPLFEFINLFIEYHIERCIASSLRDPKAANVMEVFLNELSNLTRACSQPEYLYKICLIWKGLLEDEVAKYAVLQNENCLQAGFHIFQAGLLQNNSAMESVSPRSLSLSLSRSLSLSLSVSLSHQPVCLSLTSSPLCSVSTRLKTIFRRIPFKTRRSAISYCQSRGNPTTTLQITALPYLAIRRRVQQHTMSSRSSPLALSVSPPLVWSHPHLLTDPLLGVESVHRLRGTSLSDSSTRHH
jgi:hypothetical protein